MGSAITARGALELLWDTCYEAGVDYVGTADDIEQAVGWMGERGVLTRALVEAGAPEGRGFIEPVSEPVDGVASFRVHDLWHHAPDYVTKRRQRELKRQEKIDPGSGSQTAPNGDGLGKTSACQDGTGRTPSPSPSPSPLKNGSPEASSGPSVAFLAFPIVGPGSDSWSLSEAQVAEWAELYPSLDVRGECRKAVAWVKANPDRRKTSRGMLRFLVSWLSRSNDRGGGRRQPSEVRSIVPDADDTAERLRQHRAAGGR